MVDVKSYVVQYEIAASVIHAQDQLRNLKKWARETEEGLLQITGVLDQVASAVKQVQQATNTAFKPTIDQTAFNTAIDEMTAKVKVAAADMRAALTQGLTGKQQKIIDKAGKQVVTPPKEQKTKSTGTRKSKSSGTITPTTPVPPVTPPKTPTPAPFNPKIFTLPKVQLFLDPTPAQTAFESFKTWVRSQVITVTLNAVPNPTGLLAPNAHGSILTPPAAVAPAATPVATPMAAAPTGQPATTNQQTTTQNGQKSTPAKKVSGAKVQRTRWNNALAPFQLTPQQTNAIFKNRKFFTQAKQLTGITPTATMPPTEMLKYLKAVEASMTVGGWAVPSQLKGYINKLDKQVNGKPAKAAGGGGGGMMYMGGRGQNLSTYDKMRKWGYPFTGPTSFGQRTPMAVEMAKGMGVMFAISGAISAISSSFSQAVEYQNTMETAKAILQNGTKTYTDTGYKQMEKNIRTIGVQTKFSAPEVADAARFLAMAGFDIPQINDAIRPIAELALVGDQNLGEVADKMTNIMTTFQIPAEKMREAGNIMATIATRTNTDLMMLAESAKYGGGVARMYGGNDPNLFADTMAIFGVMGNAGIQASSAGTALRMMYQNIFRPNKKQKAVLDELKSKYGISTTNEDGSYRSISSILIDMAREIPQSEMARIIGSMFRITAQPGANATIMAATAANAQEIAAMAEKEGTDVNEALKGFDEIGKFMDKFGVSKLAELMEAARRSTGGNILESTATKKQNTIQGLWAQVTSMFTEGMVKAFEARLPYFNQMLVKLRDYFAKPSTIKMLQDIFDLVIGVAEVLGTIVKLWANIYSLAPGVIKTWIIAQMVFTQFGSIYHSLVQMAGAYNRLTSSMYATTAATTAAGGGAAAAGATGSAVASGAAAGAASGAAGRAAAASAAANGGMMLFPVAGNKRPIFAPTVKRATQKAWLQTFHRAATWTPAALSLTPFFNRLKVQLVGLLGRLAGTLVNPITIAVAALSGLGVAIYKLSQVANGATEKQQEHRKRLQDSLDSASTIRSKYAQPFNELLTSSQQPTLQVVQGNSATTLAAFKKKRNAHLERWKDIINLGTEGNSANANNDALTHWREEYQNHPIYQWALGDQSKDLLFSGLDEDLVKIYSAYNSINDRSDEKGFFGALIAGRRGGVGTIASNIHKAYADPKAAKLIQDRLMQMAIMQMGGTQQATLEAYKKIVALKRSFDAGEIKAEQYNEEVNNIRSLFAGKVNAAKYSSVDITPEHFQQLTSFSHYKEYWQGALNVIDAALKGAKGTETGALDAFQKLQKDANVFQSSWYASIGNIIEGYKVTLDAISPKNAYLGTATVSLTTDDYGKLNYDDIKKQFLGTHADAVFGWQQYADIAASMYAQLAQLGLAPQDQSSMSQYILQQLQTRDSIPETDLLTWFAQHIEHNPDWAGFAYEDYAKWMGGTDTRRLANGKLWSPKQEWSTIRNSMAAQSASTFLTKYKWTPQGDYKNPYVGMTDQAKKDIKIEINVENMVKIEGATMTLSEEDIKTKVAPVVAEAVNDTISGATGNGAVVGFSY